MLNGDKYYLACLLYFPFQMLLTLLIFMTSSHFNRHCKCRKSGPCANSYKFCINKILISGIFLQRCKCQFLIQTIHLDFFFSNGPFLLHVICRIISLQCESFGLKFQGKFFALESLALGQFTGTIFLSSSFLLT